MRNQTRDRFSLQLVDDDVPDTISGLQVTSLSILNSLNVAVGIMEQLAELAARIVIMLQFGRDTIANLNYY